MVIANAVAVGRDAEACHALQETGGEPPQTAIAERGVRLGRAQAVGVDAEVAECGARNIAEAQIAKHVGQQTPDQEFEREIVDALFSLGSAGALGRQPAIDDPIADGVSGCHEPIAIGCGTRILADRQRKLGEDGALEFGELVLVLGACRRWNGL